MRLDPMPVEQHKNDDAGFQSALSLDNPSLFEGTIGRRVAAYLIDAAILLAISGAVYVFVFITLGLFAFLLPFLALLPIAYHAFLVSSPTQATIGQRIMGLKVVSNWGGRLTLVQAVILFALFYVTLAFTGGLLLLWALFDDRSRCLHDILTGSIVIRADRQDVL